MSPPARRSFVRSFSQLRPLILPASKPTKHPQAKIMRELEEALLEEEGSLHAAAAALAELDAALALASVASDFGFVRPEVGPSEE